MVTAESLIREALKISGENSDYHRSLGKVLLGMRQYDAAIDCFEIALELDPKNIDARNDLGTIYWNRSRAEEAISCFRRVLEFEPADISANNNLGLASEIAAILMVLSHAFKRLLEPILIPPKFRTI